MLPLLLLLRYEIPELIVATDKESAIQAAHSGDVSALPQPDLAALAAASALAPRNQPVERGVQYITLVLVCVF